MAGKRTVDYSPEYFDRLQEMWRQAKTSEIVHWAEEEFNWAPIRRVDEETGEEAEAWYQYIMLGCFDNIYTYPEDYRISGDGVPHKLAGQKIQKHAWRVGRQCIPYDTIILDRDGSMMPIQEHPMAWKTKDNAELYKVELSNGYSTRCTGNHPFSIRKHNKNSYEEHGKIFCYAEHLTTEDEVESLVEWDKWGNGIVPYSYERFLCSGRKGKDFSEKWEKSETIQGDLQMTNDLAELLGFLITDGNAYTSITNNEAPNFVNTNINYINRVKYLVEKSFPNAKMKLNTISAVGNNKESYQLRFHSIEGNKKGGNPVKEFLRMMNFHPSAFPRAVNYFTREQVIHFVRGAWCGDGNFYIDAREGKNKFEATFAGNLNRTYAEYWQSLIGKFGIHFKLVSQFGKKSTANFWKLRIRNAPALMKFRNTFGQIPDKLIPDGHLTIRPTFKKFLYEDFNVQKDGEKTHFLKIKNINIFKEKADCYDVEFPGKGWFFSNLLLVSNSGKSTHLALGTTYLAIKKPITETKIVAGKEITNTRGASIIIASRDDDTVKLVFEEVLKLLQSSPKFAALMDAGIIKKVMSPYPTLFFHFWKTPAKIIFRGPGEGGQATRGKTFDYKIYDEADYMPQAFFETEKATSINAVSNELTILSSTPTGRREYFYNACFVKDTPIYINEIETKPIQELQIGDSVINRFGKLEKITKVMSRNYKGLFCSFMTALDDKIITSTSSHRFMAFKQTKSYCHQCNQFVFKNKSFCPIYNSHKGYKELIPEYYYIKDLYPGDFLCIPKELEPKVLPKYCYVVGDFIFVKIIEHLMFKDENTVYNLTVGEDHSYTVNGFGVANCTNPEWDFQELHVPSHENPNYTAAKDEEMLEELKDIVYEHEILAEWGGTDRGVFDWIHFEEVFKLKENKFNPDNPDVPIMKPVYNIHQKTGRKSFDVPSEYEHIEFGWEDIQKITVPAFGGWLFERLPKRENNYKYWFGADYGYTVDPSEFLIAKEHNGVLKLICRITLRRVPYEIQAEIISALDMFYCFAGMGQDATGIGKTMQQFLTPVDGVYNKYAQHQFDKKLHSIDFSSMESIEDKLSGKPKYIPVKQYMTDEIVKLAQKQCLILPNETIDKEITKQFKNHTYVISDNGRIEYSKSRQYPDHIIDSLRTLVYAKAKSVNIVTSKNWLNSYKTFNSPR